MSEQDQVVEQAPARWVYAATALSVLMWAGLVNPHPWWFLPAYAVFACAWGAGVAIDLVRHELPDRFTVAPVALFLAALLPWVTVHDQFNRWLATAIASLVTAVVLFVLAFINPKGFGLGDVKLGFATGAALGWIGSGATSEVILSAVGLAMIGIAVGFVLMAVLSLLLLALKQADRSTDIAFGPFMVAGVLMAPWASSLLL